MKKAVVFLFLCVAAAPAAAQTLSLEECRAAAVEHNRTLRNSRLDLDAASQTRREAFTNYFPQISASGGLFQAQHGLVQADFAVPQMGTLPVSLVKRGIVGSVTAVQPLFTGLKIVTGNKLARLGEEVGRLQLQKTESEVREQTDAYYWQVVSLRDNLSTIEAVERQLEEIHRQVELSVKAGLVTTNDLLRVELRQQEIASNRLKVENGLKVSKMLLAQHIGVDWRAFDVAAAEFGQPEAPAAFYVPVEEALDNRAEYRLAEKNVEAQKYRKRMERGKRLPTVGIGAGYLYYNVTDKSVDDGMVFAQVSVPVSEWWGGAHALKKARIREQQAENDRLQAREMLAVEIDGSPAPLTLRGRIGVAQGNAGAFCLNGSPVGEGRDLMLPEQPGPNIFGVNYAPGIYTTVNSQVVYTVTVEDDAGFAQSFDIGHRFANRLDVYIPPATAENGNGTVTVAGALYDAEPSFLTHDRVVLCHEKGCTLTAVPEAGYRFEGWYSAADYKTRLSTSASYLSLIHI